MSSAVRGKVGAVRLAQALERRRCLDGESLAGDGAEQWAGERSAVIGEADKALIESRVPQRREQETVVDVEALLVITIGPWHDVRGSQKPSLGNASEWAALPPVIQQSVAKYILSNALHDQSLGLHCSRQGGGFSAKTVERRVRQTHGELVNAIERGMEFGQRFADEGGRAWAQNG